MPFDDADHRSTKCYQLLCRETLLHNPLSTNIWLDHNAQLLGGSFTINDFPVSSQHWSDHTTVDLITYTLEETNKELSIKVLKKSVETLATLFVYS